MYKLFLVQVLVVFALWHVSESRVYTQDELDLLARVHYDQIPRHLQLMLRRGKKIGDTSNWCCKNGADQVVSNTQMSKIASKTIRESVQTHTQDGCGFLNTKTCETTDIKYVEKLITYIDYQLVPNKSVCPDEQITCCSGFVLAVDNCLAAEGQYLSTLTDALIKLQGAGLLG
ncbi:uncharacterized protein LOC110448613 [Mizuhopecten yessoensis]|uniref:uncharacterized protein LOC110448613 n=1 Tax=Mizuhopecten yessoensis TaxID=6573 RepID=UPI000B45F3EB|nr:uncharacterized protein LOC110448613 [Mizuhopecten yessoensis]